MESQIRKIRMNKYSIKYLIFCAVSLIFVSCTEFENVQEGMAGADGSWLVSASISAGERTRISEIDNLLYWQEGDEVAFRAVSGSASHVVSDQVVLSLNKLDSGLESAKFRGSVTMSEQPSECYFAYPSTSSIAGTGAVTFDFSVQDGRIHSPYLYGSAVYDPSGFNCALKHAAALIRLNVPSGVTKVDVSANSLTNDVTFDMSTQKISKVIVDQDGTMNVTDDATDKITVTVDPSKTNYIFVPAISFVDGFSFYMETGDGDVIVKSYSVDGGKYSDYSFEAGSVIDIDYSGENAPAPLNLSCVLSEIQNHDVKDGLLTGTTVSIQSFTVEGVPAKVIDAWGVAVYDGDAEKGTMVRWVNGSGSFNSPGLPLAVYNDWPLLLPDKTYNIYAVCQINGKTHYAHSGTLNVPELPALSLGLQAETSHSVYKEQGADAANAKDGYSIFDIKVATNISHLLLNNSNYSTSVILTSSGNHRVEWTSASNVASNEYNAGTWTGVNPGSYTIYGSILFAGKSANVSLVRPVSGLPADLKNFTSASQLVINKTTFTKTFYVTENTNVIAESSGTVTGQGTSISDWTANTTKFTVSLSDTQIFTKSVKGGTLRDVTEAYKFEVKDKQITSLNPTLKLTTDDDNATVTSISVRYR